MQVELLGGQAPMGEPDHGAGPVRPELDLMFSHLGFEPDDPIIAVITPAWVRFLDNLVAVAESGRANPAVVN